MRKKAIKKHVFCVEMEIGALPGRSLPDGSAGVFVNIYVGADSLKDALAQIEPRLAQDLYKTIFIWAAYVMDSRHESRMRNHDDFPDEHELFALQEGRTIHYGKFHDEYSDEDLEY